MARRGKATQARKTGRRWHIPPPLVHGAEPLEGGEVLAEGSGPEAVLLWRGLRDVMIWAQTPPGERGLLFSEGSRPAVEPGGEPAPNPHLKLLLSLSSQAQTLSPAEVAAACRALSERLEAEGRPAGALGFAQAAALVMPGDAGAAFHVGRIARKRADHARAEVWYRRAIGLARQARDWRLYSLSFRSLGELYALRGNYPVARRLQIRALRGARRGGMRSEQGHALHDLFTTAVEMGSFGEAEEFARQALEAYRPRNERLPHLAHDLAYFWMDRGEFSRALPVFEALAPHFGRPVERLFVTANLARATAGVGEVEAFERHWADAWERLEARRGEDDGAARALLDLARGAETLKMWDRAEAAAARSLSLATERVEGKVRFAAESVLEAARRRWSVTETKEPAAPRGGAASASTQQLATHVVEALQALAGEGR